MPAEEKNTEMISSHAFEMMLRWKNLILINCIFLCDIHISMGSSNAYWRNSELISYLNVRDECIENWYRLQVVQKILRYHKESGSLV